MNRMDRINNTLLFILFILCIHVKNLRGSRCVFLCMTLPVLARVALGSKITQAFRPVLLGEKEQA